MTVSPKARKSVSNAREGMSSRSVVTTTNDIASQKESLRLRPYLRKICSASVRTVSPVIYDPQMRLNFIKKG